MYSPPLSKQSFIDKLLVIAINHNQEFLLQLAAITEAHHERLADVTQGRSYFRLHDQVRSLCNFSYGTVKQIRPNHNHYDYLIAWFNTDNSQKWQWIPETELILLSSF